MDGRQISIRRDGVTQPGFVSVIDDEGMPVHGTMVSNDLDHAEQVGRDMLFGKLYLEWQVVLPEKVDHRLQQSKFYLLRADRCSWSLTCQIDSSSDHFR